MSGKTVLVTGSTLGMGLAIAKGFHACGARTIISSNIQQDLDSAVGEWAAKTPPSKASTCDLWDTEHFGPDKWIPAWNGE